MLFTLLLAGVMNFVMYYTSSSIVLRMYGGKVVTASEPPELYQMVDELRQQAGLPMPTVAIAPHAQPNAFASGRNAEHAVVCVTEGILRGESARRVWRHRYSLLDPPTHDRAGCAAGDARPRGLVSAE